MGLRTAIAAFFVDSKAGRAFSSLSAPEPPTKPLETGVSPGQSSSAHGASRFRRAGLTAQ